MKEPACSSFVFGPRAVGKTTWARQTLPAITEFDLLDTSSYGDIVKDPNLVYRRLEDQREGTWVLIDEIQRVPDLLNEVHRLIENVRINFLMTGSSAYKLRRGGVNLLGGRASHRKMFPLVAAELAEDFDLDRALQYGSLPNAANVSDAVDYLLGYVSTYISQEILAETRIRDIGTFARFLEVAARQNGQTVNPTSIARDVGASRPTVVGHYEILIDSFFGNWVTAWQARPGNRQIQQSKFYFFDCGVVRAIQNRVAFPPSDNERGILLETLLLHELTAFLEYSEYRFPVQYWRTYDGAEIDFIVEMPDRVVAIDVKNSSRWQSKFNRGFRRFKKDCPLNKTVDHYGVFCGSAAERWDDIHILPIGEFLKHLWDHEVISI